MLAIDENCELFYRCLLLPAGAAEGAAGAQPLAAAGGSGSSGSDNDMVTLQYVDFPERRPVSRARPALSCLFFLVSNLFLLGSGMASLHSASGSCT